jgi:hypothetical protein
MQQAYACLALDARAACWLQQQHIAYVSIAFSSRRGLAVRHSFLSFGSDWRGHQRVRADAVVCQGGFECNLQLTLL